MSSSRLLYLSPVELDSFAQRPHHFVHWFHERHDAEVLWLNPYPARLPRWGDLARFKKNYRPRGLGPAWAKASWLQQLHLPALPLEPLPFGRWINHWLWQQALSQIDRFVDAHTTLVFGKPCALALLLASRYPQQVKVYDVMDNVPAFSGGCSQRWLRQAENALAERVDLLVTSSTALKDKFSSAGRQAICIRNGLTLPAEAGASPRYVSADGKLVFGYIGTIASWFDWDAVVELAQRYPDARVRLIGPVESPRGGLPANVELLPAIPQHEVYATLRSFSVGLIPFKIDDVTDYVDPVKYYEYRAMGLPVLSTRFGEMRLRGDADHVLFMEDLQGDIDWAVLIRSASVPTTVETFVHRHLWSTRFDALSTSLNEHHRFVSVG
jgi:glycosyltransferase involved in cell wall biosynthesis